LFFFYSSSYLNSEFSTEKRVNSTTIRTKLKIQTKFRAFL
jgi:hypothetical protein